VAGATATCQLSVRQGEPEDYSAVIHSSEEMAVFVLIGTQQTRPVTGRDRTVIIPTDGLLTSDPLVALVESRGGLASDLAAAGA